MKKGILLFLIICISTDMYSQLIKADMKDYEERPKSINEVIKQLGADSIIFYYNDRYQMVKPKCSSLFRLTRIDSVLSFFAGDFIDYYPDSIIALTGNYTDGMKQGLFQFYYPNGQLEKIGNYSKGNKTGVWKYYYEDGNRHQILEFIEKEINVIEFWNEKGKHLVDSSNGDWFGFETQEQFTRISGKILNGKKAGVWKKDIPSRNFVMNVENFSNGKFIKGNSTSMMNGTEPYNDTSYCAIEPPETFLTAEIFEINQCYPKMDNRWVFAKYPNGSDNFKKEIEEKLILTNSLNINGTLRIQTTIDTEGKMTNFKPISNLGLENDLIKVLETMKNWKPTKVNGKPVSQIKFIDLDIR